MISKVVSISKNGNVTASYATISKLTPEEVHVITDALAFQQDHAETFDGSKWDPHGIREKVLMRFISIDDELKAGCADGNR